MLKIKEGYIMRQVAGEYVVLPTGTELPLNRMITLNKTGAFLWERLQTGMEEADLVAALLENYEVDEELALQSTRNFLGSLRQHQLLAE